MNEYRAYLSRLKELVATEVVPKMAIFDYFTDHIYRRDAEPTQVEPLMVYLQSALTSDLTFSIFRLYDRKGGHNIYHFLKHTRTYLSSIDWKHPLTLEDLAKQEQQLHQLEPLVTKLKERRNKLFGHYDRKYFYEPDQLDVDLAFSNEDAKSLVRLLQAILADHSRALVGTASISIDGFIYLAAERMYEKLRAAPIRI